LEGEIQSLGTSIFEVYRPLLADIYESLGEPSSDKVIWQAELQAELFEAARSLKDPSNFGVRFWDLVCDRLPKAFEWRQKFLLLQFLCDMPAGVSKQRIWTIAYGGKEPLGNAGGDRLELIRTAYNPFLDTLNRLIGEVQSHTLFEGSEMRVISDRDEATLQSWLLR
jgi:hypothetical protein